MDVLTAGGWGWDDTAELNDHGVQVRVAVKDDTIWALVLSTLTMANYRNVSLGPIGAKFVLWFTDEIDDGTFTVFKGARYDHREGALSDLRLCRDTLAQMAVEVAEDQLRLAYGEVERLERLVDDYQCHLDELLDVGVRP